MKTRRALDTVASLALAMAVLPGSGVWAQTAAAAAAIPQFPPGPGYAGVAGSAAENARITALCGANRNAKDGYFAPPAFPEQTRAPLAHSRQPFKIEVLAKLDRSVGLAFLPDGKLLISQRAGGLRTIDAKGAVSEPLKGAPVIAGVMGTSNTGPLLDRHFAKNRTFYYGYTTAPAAKGEAYMGHILRARLADDETSLEELAIVYEAPYLAPRRLAQLRDGTLVIASGEVESGGPNPQSMTDPRGKLLRINTDGSIPKDNPFVHDPKANPALYAVGFRDVQGLAINPTSGELWAAENEPKGGDELNRIKAGANYGFPIISYGRQNSGALINDGKTAQPGLEQPVYYWTPSIAPSGLAFYSGAAFPAWKHSAFVGGMSGEQLVRLEMKGGKVVGEEKLLMDRCKRTKDVSQGPDGLIYVITDETPSEVLRISPAK